MLYCPQCGAETEPEATFCGDCGARLEEQATPPERQPKAPGPAARGDTTPWSRLGALVVVGGLALGLIALYDAAANDGEWADSVFGGDSEEPAVASLTPTPQRTVELIPTVEATPTTTPQPSPTVEPTPSPEPTPGPTATPPASGYATPEEAISAFFQEAGMAYVGDCEGASLETDSGAYCTSIWEDGGDTRTYRAGLTFSEYDTWLLVSRPGAGDGWTVVDSAVFVPGEDASPWQGPTPQDAVGVCTGAPGCACHNRRSPIRRRPARSSP